MGHSRKEPVVGKAISGIEDDEPVRGVTGMAPSVLMASDVPQVENEAFEWRGYRRPHPDVQAYDLGA